MANTGVSGRVLDDSGQGIAGLVVGAYDVGLFGLRLLVNTTNSADPVPELRPYARTGADGSFSVSCIPGKYDLVVKVFDSVLRLVGVGEIHHDVTDPVLTLDDSELQTTADLAGGLVAKTGQFSQSLDGNALTALVDNHDAWSELISAVDHAQTSIDWMLFYLDIGRMRMTFNPDSADPGGPMDGRRLEDALKAAASRGVTVRLACNQLMTTDQAGIRVPWPATTARRVADALQGTPNITVKPITTHFTAPIHAKFVVIDNADAWLIGSPFVSDYYDDYTHLLSDARHGSFGGLIDSRQVRVPVHDVSLRVNGPVIQQLSQTFLTHWTGDSAATPPAAPASVGSVRLQVVRSMAGNSRWAGLPSGEATIVESYLRAISQATKFIYLENQYFTSHEIADALILRIRATTDVEVVILTNNKVDIPNYDDWQPETMLRIVKGLSASERKRVGFFTTWTHAAGATAGGAVVRNYIHSKVAIVDDNWATVGSANLDGASLTHSQSVEAGRAFWFSALVWPLARYSGDTTQDRESETNLTVFDGSAGGPVTNFAADLRRQLWAEHLGYAAANGRPDATAADLQHRPSGGWLSLWNAKADAKLAGLKASPASVNSAKILRVPFAADAPSWPSKANTASGYLTWAGVDTSKLAVYDGGFRRFDWSKGAWIDKER